MTFVSELKPHALWAHFDHILTIPRASKDEGRMREYIIEVAERNGLEYEVDAAGNTVVRKPAAPGRESVPATILQAHLDMVQEKNSGVALDFETDAIEPLLEGEYLTADGTTLGSDNGVGVAAMLAIEEDPELSHGPLELLFTVDEETGLTGAASLEPEMLKGRRLLNLDSEEEGVITIGCAGGADSHLRLPVSHDAPPDGVTALSVQVSGLRGGHSGVDIHLQRGNAIRLLARALYVASLEEPFHLASFSGGNAHNAIPREASATVALSGDAVDRFRATIQEEAEAMQKEFAAVDPGLSFDVSDAGAVESVMDSASTQRTLGFVTALPHGVMSMSYDIPGLVETSTNLATVTPTDGGLDILLSSRSSVDSALSALRQRIRAAASLVQADVAEGDGYPGWQPDVSSPILGTVKSVYAEMMGEPEVGAVHAGLECGIIGEKIAGMDMVSFGPQIEFPHSPDERVHIESVDKFYSILCAVLERLE